MADRVEKTNINLKGESMPAFMGENASIDWRGRPCKSNKHGGMTAAVFVLGLSLSLSLSSSLSSSYGLSKNIHAYCSPLFLLTVIYGIGWPLALRFEKIEIPINNYIIC
jgi:hypothetical protein